MLDRYKLDQFYQGEGTETQYSSFQKIDDSVYSVEKLQIVSMAMDFPKGTSLKARNEIEKKWIEQLPKLKKIKSLSIRHRVKQDFFEAICKMTNLEELTFWSSPIEDISSILNLKKLKYLKLWHFSKLKDISPLVALNKLTHLSIDTCFKVENYEILGRMTQLIGLELCGDTLHPEIFG
jgi:hypothetical protein